MREVESQGIGGENVPNTKLSEMVKAKQCLDRLIRMYLSANHMTLKALAKRMGTSPSTLDRRMRNQGGFSLSELQINRYILGIPLEEMLEALRGKL